VLAYRAAMGGPGVVTGPLPLLGPDLAAGRLVPLLDRPIRQGSYYAVWRTDRGRGRKAGKFLGWLQPQLDTSGRARGRRRLTSGCNEERRPGWQGTATKTGWRFAARCWATPGSIARWRCATTSTANSRSRSRATYGAISGPARRSIRRRAAL